MAIKVSKDGTTVVFVFEGTIEGKAALDMEKAVAANVTGDVRAVIADFANVQLLTSAAIRQFLLLRKRMASSRGGLVLCAVNDRVRTLLEIAGLWSQFTVAATREQAMALVTAPPKAADPAAAPQPSRVGALLYSLLGAQSVAPAPAGSAEPAAGASVDALVSYLEDVLGPRGDRPPKPTPGA